MRALTCIAYARCCTIPCLAFLVMTFSLSTQAQGIFEDLPYNEQTIRNTISKHTLQFSSPDNPDAVPEHIFYQQVFIDLLVDPGAIAQLPADDAALIRALPAHQDASFVEQDQAELASLCERLAGVGEQEAGLVGAAEAFDQSRFRREYGLDVHYATVMKKLSEPTQRLLLDRLTEIRTQRHITYAVFSLGGLAAEAPDVAGAILRSGCDRFAETTFELRSITLADQLREQQPVTYNN